jgi:hypothetical protein
VGTLFARSLTCCTAPFSIFSYGTGSGLFPIKRRNSTGGTGRRIVIV